MKSIKYNNLIQYLKELESVVVAFSGGVDSTFLLKACEEALGRNAVAVTIVSPFIPKWEITEAKELIEDMDTKHEFIEVSLDQAIKFNPEDRCYLCKKGIFSTIKNYAKENGLKYVLDGTNLDDTKDYRPGIKALRELQIKSPLLENELTKSEIRELSKELNLPTWDKPAYACLLSRLTYGSEIKDEELIRIEKSEVYMMTLGFREVRVRSHGDLARIEVNRNKRKSLFDEVLFDKISSKLKEFGFKYVTLDLQGYRVGSLNETINDLDKK
ncbi:ATP-dependent sacrificial sulfur transferase LarE [Clostridium sediminicola]|uniref:ATP-dependent sacrificial sulfur transferase LarE n=1 Tax=Clostridium sediminicola TaxID=3114879 RepID=UPI0031F1FF56